MKNKDTKMIKYYKNVKQLFEYKKEKIEKGLDKYYEIMEMLKQTDIAVNLEFQKKYRYFYKVYRRTNQFCSDYFKYFEEIKNNINIDFETILRTISSFRKNNELEMSFSSKILHSINPDLPIWDSIVTKEHFGILAPKKCGKSDRIIEASKIYYYYKDEIYKYMNSYEGNEIITCFNDYFPNNEISNVKKIDFVLWQDRK